jgi:hypothetical protein
VPGAEHASRAWRFSIDTQAVKGVADSGDVEADIVELMAEVGAAAAQHGSGAAFFPDELQFLGPRSLAMLATTMHGISQLLGLLDLGHVCIR